MTPKLSAEQQQALNANSGAPVYLQHPGTQQVFVLVDSETHEQAMRALRQQEDLDAIRQGITEMEAGLTIPIEEADRRMRQELGLPPRE